jgi:tRNA-dihydrouridine synthase B
MRTNYHHPVKIGDVDIPGNLFFAPVAGYSDAAFRSVCFGLGADLCYTEMVSAEALTRGHVKTKSLLARADDETRYAIQLFGSKPEVLGKASSLCLPYAPTLVDLNCGCPVPKIVKSGSGSALLKDPGHLKEVVAAMVEALKPAKIPVTVKIRLGWEDASLNYLETARAAVEAGAAAVTLHARTRSQGYSGKADWAAIARLARELPVPVFGSGDIFKADDARRLLEETLCAGVMVARGAMGDPFIFRETRALLEGGDCLPLGTRERAEVARRHLELEVGFHGERTACIEFRKQFCAYTKGTEGGAELRGAAVKALSLADYEPLFERWVSLGEK